jgi:hypothetical protein
MSETIDLETRLTEFEAFLKGIGSQPPFHPGVPV